MMNNLLVVEDNKAIASVIEHIGGSLGYRVTIAYSFAELKSLLVSHHDFFAATVDYSLPDAVDGQAIFHVLEHSIPCIVMTGKMNNTIHQKLLSLPIVDYLTKENSQAYHYLLRVLHGQLTNHEIGVLVVDDSMSVRSYVCNLLSRRNFTLYDVPDGTKALNALAMHPEIKLIITDQEMPGMNGIELVQAVRKQFADRELVIVGYSGIDKPYQSARFIKSGADDYLQKPFCPEEFYCRVFKNVEKLQYIEEIKMAADMDYLTSLSNRRHFIEQLTEHFDELLINNLEHLLIFIHVDEFKGINESFGHSGGDKILVELAELLKKSIEPPYRARFGGAEFCCLISGSSLMKNREQVEKLTQAASALSFTLKEREMCFKITVGGAQMCDKSTVKTLLSQADTAFQKALSQGGNSTVIHDVQEGDKVKSRD
ncbi:GGDEF domain-containing response regulator [Shewanella woodyi]|uniref:GGDEF domain-containing response regulator n=1 Tax=Shewanella woodyi TaxID=60961 RepID=UPI0007F8DED3|nr:diguanylate cyclase [Shewanella woodyi]